MKRNVMAIMFALILGQFLVFSQDKGSKKSEPVKPALIIIDTQNQFLPMIPEGEKNIALRFINGYISVFRKQNLPIIRVYHTDPEWGPHPDSSGFQYLAAIQVKPDDPQIIKNYPSSFKKTSLEKILREKQCNTLFLCGLSSVGCVIATYFAAKDLDFKTFMLKDAIMSHNANYTDSIEEIFGALSYDTVSFILDQVGK